MRWESACVLVVGRVFVGNRGLLLMFGGFVVAGVAEVMVGT